MAVAARTFFLAFSLTNWSCGNYDRIVTMKNKDPMLQPCVFWFTGLPCSGKTTLSEEVLRHLKKKKCAVEHLDGDAIRKLFPKMGFSKEERNAHVSYIGFLASKLEKNGVFVVVSLISPYAEARRFVRGLCNHFIEIYLSTPLEECEQRDRRGLYKKAREGKIKFFTGLDDPYEIPTSPEITIDTSRVSVKDAVFSIFKYLKQNHFGVEKKI